MLRAVTTMDTSNEQYRKEAPIFLHLAIGAQAAYIFIWQAILALYALKSDSAPPPAWLMSTIAEFIALGIFFICLKKTSLRFSDCGVLVTKKQLKSTLPESLAISVASILAMVLVKLLLMKMRLPYAEYPFWDWHFHDDPTQFTYFFAAPYQEFLTRGVVQTILVRLSGGGHIKRTILVVSLFFGTFHASYGILIMVAAAAISFFLGLLYQRHRNIWGVTLIHFSVGFVGTCLGFI